MWKQHIKILIVTLLLFNTAISVKVNIQPNEYRVLADPSPQTIVYVDPQNVTASVGENITIDVKVANVTNFWGLEIQFRFDPTLLEYQSHTVKIPVDTYPDGILNKPTFNIKDNVNTTDGTYLLASTSTSIPPNPFNGTGIAFNMTFTVSRIAACYLHFTSTSLSNSSTTGWNAIPHEAKDGNFWSTPSPSFAPIANFTFSPDTSFVNRTVVTLNASTSYDPDGGNITKYMWNFGDGTSENTTDPVITHCFQKKSCDVTLTAMDDEDSLSVPLTKEIPVRIYRDISITSVQAPPQILHGLHGTINVTVANLGDIPEGPIQATTYYNETAVDPANITTTTWAKIEGKTIQTAVEPAAEHTLTFSWDTEDATPEAHYYIMANATLESGAIEANVTNNVMLSDTLTYVALAKPIATFTHSPNTPITNEEVIFDASASYDIDGSIISYMWNLGDGTIDNETVITHVYTAPGNYNVTLTVTDNDGLTSSTTRYVEIATYYPIDVTIDAGAVYFGGETAEFYILTSREGERINASEITATLYFNEEKLTEFQYPTSIKIVGTGIYRIPFTIPDDASSGTYTLIVDASVKAGYLDLMGTNIKSLFISSTLTGWNGLLISINGTVGTIKIDAGLVQLKLDEINATIVDIQGTLGIINSTVGTFNVNLDTVSTKITDLIVNARGELLAEIDTALGTVTTKLDNINATVTEVNGNTVTINTTLGEVKDTVGATQSTATMGLTAASILSLIAAIAAVMILLKKKPSKPA